MKRVGEEEEEEDEEEEDKFYYVAPGKTRERNCKVKSKKIYIYKTSRDGQKKMKIKCVRILTNAYTI
jgi:hypothetical protein